MHICAHAHEHKQHIEAPKDCESRDTASWEGIRLWVQSLELNKTGKGMEREGEGKKESMGDWV